MFGERFKFTLAFLVIIFVILLYVNGAIWWSIHDSGPFFMEFFDLGNLILGFLFKGWSLGIDEHFGINFFAPITWWIVDGITYFTCYSAVIILIWNLYYVNDFENPNEGIIYKMSATVFFILFYRCHLLDFMEFFKFISMPEHGKDIEYYFWITIGFWVLNLINNYRKRILSGY